ncbi:MAG TPA: DoxX family protein [Bacteroidia bacterium]|jgi:putative oxidoreductase|nr:DoxX family protein [Bacteroidia bacterium]
MNTLHKLIKTSHTPTLLIRLTVGLIFVSEGMQKFIFPDTLGMERFSGIGFANPLFWASFAASFEIICGLLLLIGLLTRLASIPLLIIMVTALVTTKWTILIHKGFFPFAHEYRTDFAMTMLLIYLLIQGGGKKSMDIKLYGEAAK